MNRKLIVFFIFVPSMFFLTGCWDSMELNDRAIELAWGIDKAKNKDIQISTQIIIPSKIGGGQGGGSGGSQGKPFFVATGIGKDTLDAVQQMQTKLSRQIFRGQRRVIVIGESLARQGIKDVLDTYTRDPNINLLTDIFVIKGGTAKDFLKTSYPLENIPALGALKEYNQMGALNEVGFLNFLLSATSEGSYPTMPAIAFGSPSSSSIGDQSNTKGFSIAGTGIFNKDLKLIGFLDVEAGKVLRWVTGNLDKLTITAFVPQKKGYVSLDINKLDSMIKPMMQRNKIKIFITLNGQGMIRENNTSLDLTQIKNITIAQKALDKHVEKMVLKTVTKIQKEYGTDVFGISDVIQRKNPHQWKSLEKNWDRKFSEAEVSVKVNLTVRRIGVTGPSIFDRKSD
ncbi:Ger(x)C family spore germination protein [Bacillus sp. ISL-75]|uniref:Ger(x)C family spore germination protein n=1 Tax=Bacillus sp. ISL-75 TaxID=2819137 RepID=UPI001BE4E2CC|nr:Ger(x)C family spore germination protein [Bacillus sp. ISL-75]MBT2729582.1 Ger(x)C family spore germination protein [Bacillus sp. ISL-75]